MGDTERFGESRDPFSAGRVYWLRGLAMVLISIAVAFAAAVVHAVGA